MIHIVITSYKEPKSTVRAINRLLEQENLKEKFKIILVDPFPEVWDYVKKRIRSKKVSFFLDPGDGKGYALNILFEQIYSKNKNDIIVLTDGDVYVSKNAVVEILEKFKDPKVGCVTGRPISIDSRKTKYGLWSKIAFAGIDKQEEIWQEKKASLNAPDIFLQ